MNWYAPRAIGFSLLGILISWGLASPANAAGQSAAPTATVVALDLTRTPELHLGFPDLNSQAAMLPARQPTLPDIPTVQDQTLIPLPPAAWSGLVGLVALGIFGCRKAIVRFVM